MKRDGKHLEWYLHNWLNLDVIAELRGEDMTLMTIMIEMEQEQNYSPTLKNQLRTAWSGFNRENRPAYLRYWEQKTLQNEEAEKYISDLNRMLVCKGPKVRSYIHHMQMKMEKSLRSGKFTRADRFFDIICLLTQKLEDEKTKDAEAEPQLSNSANDDDVEMEDLDIVDAELGVLSELHIQPERQRN